MELWRVGGCVRDVLLGKQPSDIDWVVVGSTPEEMIKLGYSPVGNTFPVFLKNGGEYALARTERKTGSGHTQFETFFSPDVTLEDDLSRRDLTINAMAVKEECWEAFLAAEPEHKAAFVYDPWGGLTDLKNKTIKPVRLDTFVEDPLRLVRAARFASVLDMSWAGEMFAAAGTIKRSGELKHLSAERFCIEVDKVLEKCDIDGIIAFKHKMSHFVGDRFESSNAMPLSTSQRHALKDNSLAKAFCMLYKKQFMDGSRSHVTNSLRAELAVSSYTIRLFTIATALIKFCKTFGENATCDIDFYNLVHSNYQHADWREIVDFCRAIDEITGVFVGNLGKACREITFDTACQGLNLEGPAIGSHLRYERWTAALLDTTSIRRSSRK